jgi:hypothetical protein
VRAWRGCDGSSATYVTPRGDCTYTDESTFWVCPSKRRLGIDLWSKVGRGPNPPTLRHRSLPHVRDDGLDRPAGRLGIVSESAIELRNSRRRVAIVTPDVRRDGGKLRRRWSTGGIVRALGVVLGRGLPGRRLPLGRRIRELARATSLRSVWRCRRQGLHGRVSLGSRGQLLRGVQPSGATARQVRLVMGSHGILHARVGIVSVLHGDVAVAVAELGRGDGRRCRVLGGSALVLLELEAGGRLGLLHLAIVFPRQLIVSVVSSRRDAGVLVGRPLGIHGRVVDGEMPPPGRAR